MVLREEQERLQLLLREAIPMMCKNGVPYQTEFCVEALIGITIDKSDVVLVSIKETFNKDGAVCQTPEKSPKKRRRKRRKSNSSKQSDVSSGDSDNDQSHPQGGSDGDSYPEPARKTMKPDPNYDDYEDNEDELVTIKAEPVNIQGDHSEYEQGDQTFDTFTTTQSPTQNPQNVGVGDGNNIRTEDNGNNQQSVVDMGMECGEEIESAEVEQPKQSPTSGKFECTDCDRSFARLSGLTKHKSTHESGPRGCSFCEMVFENGTQYEIHFQREHCKIAHVCDHCGKCFKSKEGLSLHVKKHTGDFNHRCDDCGRGFMYQSELQQHYNSHTGEKPYRCKKCGGNFSHSSSLAKHVRICGVKDKPYKCAVCQKCFGDPRYLKEHMNVHNPGAYQCGNCGKQFNFRHSLTLHQKKYHCENLLPPMSLPKTPQPSSDTPKRSTVLSRAFEKRSPPAKTNTPTSKPSPVKVLKLGSNSPARASTSSQNPKIHILKKAVGDIEYTVESPGVMIGQLQLENIVRQVAATTSSTSGSPKVLRILHHGSQDQGMVFDPVDAEESIPENAEIENVNFGHVEFEGQT